MYWISQQEVVNLNNEKQSCDESNEQVVSNCIQSNIIEKLGCKPNWFKGFNNSTICSGSKLYEKYVNLTKAENVKDECLKQNCLQRKWLTKEFMSSPDYGTKIQFTLRNKVKFKL